MPFNKTIVLTSPSGAGKTSIARRVLEEFHEMHFSVSATTRPARKGETDGIEYHFLSEGDFQRQITAGELLEYEEVYPGLFYGTPMAEVAREDNHPVLLDIDVKGAERVKDLLDGNALTIFIQPPSLKELERRLLGRGTETAKTLEERLVRAEMEMTYSDLSDVVIVNDTLEDAVSETLACVNRFLRGVTYE